MGAIGAGLTLIALGAILNYAVTGDLSWIRLDVVGVVLMVVGFAALGVGLLAFKTRRRSTVVTQRRIWEEPGEPDEEVIEERRIYDEPPLP